jgi:signal transduction histidine kinase
MAGDGGPPGAAASAPPGTSPTATPRGTPSGTPPARDRPSGLRSIRNRILLPVVLAVVALTVLGAVQTGDAVREARAAQRTRVLAQLSSTAVALIHHVQLEYSETNALRQRGGEAGAQLLTAARARTDAAAAKFDAAGRRAVAAVSGLAGAVRRAERALRSLGPARNLAPGSVDGSVELFDVYDQITEELIAVADAAPALLDDVGLVEAARAVVIVAELEHLAAKQLDLLRRVFNRQRLEPGELVRLAGWAGGEHQRRDELLRLTGPAAGRFAALVTGPDVNRAARLRDAVLDSDGGARALRADPDDWYVAQSGLLRRLRILEVELSTVVEDRASAVQSAARTRTAATAGLTLLVVAGALTGATVLAVRTSRRMRRMRRAALDVAHAELPETVARVTAATDATTVGGALRESSARVDAVMAAGTDEIGELGTAFGAIHRQAVRLAADQALLRMEVEAIFVALSRRGQSLAQRQLHLIGEFERTEPDPSRRSRLYAIDHLAARMRRNEENLLVLAGGEPGRRFLAPVAVIDTLTASVGEVEEHARIEVAEAPPVAVVAHAVGDVIHLLAELLENATTFSPPDTTVRVTARRTVSDLYITVYDQGIGMPPEKLAEANQRLARPSALTSSLVGTMGLLVIARLALRHGIQVQLSSTPGGGTAATVILPERLLAATPTADELRWGRLPGREMGQADEGQSTLSRPYASAPRPDGWPEPSPAPRPATPPEHASPARSAAAVPSAHAGFTAAGLPRRVAGAVARPATAAATPNRATAAGHPPAAGPPDPDAARARLSSLASGIAAARGGPAVGGPADLSQPSHRQES